VRLSAVTWSAKRRRHIIALSLKKGRGRSGYAGEFSEADRCQQAQDGSVRTSRRILDYHTEHHVQKMQRDEPRN
jgi:hypothetical protein